MQRDRESIFFIAMAVAMTVVVFAGFARTFFLSGVLETKSAMPLAPIFHIHGIIYSAWMLLLIIQPTLIRKSYFSAHRALGWLGCALIIGIVISGVLVGLEAAGRPPDALKSPKDPQFLGVILFGILMFAVLAGLAIAYRRNPAYHKRLMMLATVNLLQAAVVRLPVNLPGDFGPLTTFLYADLFILPIVAWDVLTTRRIHPATLWGGAAILLSLPLRFWFSGTDVWLGIARWAIDTA